MIILSLILVILIIMYYVKSHKYIIENGNIVFRNFNKNYDLEKLMRDLAKNKIRCIDDIQRAYLLFGKLVVKENKPLVLIADGKLDYNALMKSKKGVEFIYRMLKNKSLNISKILYVIYLNNRFYVVKK